MNELGAIGRLSRVPLREVWAHEAYDFTRWLQDNIDVLTSAIGIGLENVEREQSAGAFNIDLVAEDEAGAKVIIENQLGKSDHDHLGKVLTYLAAMNARAAVWIVADPRPEHVAAVTKAVAAQNREFAQRYDLREQWWVNLLSRPDAHMHKHLTPGRYSWIGLSSGVRGINFNYAVRQHDCQVEVYIDRGQDCDDENRHIFEQLAARKDQFEEAFGGPLQWEALEGKRACRISHAIDGGYKTDPEGWDEIHDTLVAAMNRLALAVRPCLPSLRLDSR